MTTVMLQATLAMEPAYYCISLLFIPQVMAALRNTAIGLLRGAGQTNIAAACRRLAAQPAQALALIGIEFEN